MLYHFIKVFAEGIAAGDSHHSKIGCCPVSKSNWYLKVLELVMVLGILHLLQNNALLHLSDILFLNYSHQMFESSIHSVRVKLITLSDALREEVVTSFL